jgi:hypothetical protein
MLSPPKTKLGQFSLMFITECISFFIIVANTRAFTQGSYLWTAITDTFFSAQAFFMMKLMADNKEARTFWAGLGCTIGGTVGSLLSIYVTKHIFGK